MLKVSCLFVLQVSDTYTNSESDASEIHEVQGEGEMKEVNYSHAFEFKISNQSATEEEPIKLKMIKLFFQLYT